MSEIESSTPSLPTATVPSTAGLIGLLSCGFMPTIAMFTIGVDLPKIAIFFGAVPHAQLLAQLLSGVTGLSFALSSPLIGSLIERYGYRMVYIVSLAASGIIGVLPMALNSLTLILLSRCVLGLTVAGSITAGMAGLSLLPEAIRGKMFGRMAVVAGMGTIVFYPLTGFLAGLGWRMAFLVNLLPLLVLPLVFALPREPAQQHGADKVTRASGSLGISAGLVLISAFVGMLMIAGPMFAPFYLNSINITDPKLTSIPLSAMSASNLATTLCYGWLHARFGTKTIFVGILLASGIGMLWAGASVTLLLFSCGLTIASCGMSLFVPNLGAAISAAATGGAARGIGIAMSAIFAVQALFPFVVAGIRSFVGPQGVFLGLGAASLAICAGFVFIAPRQRAAMRHSV